MTDTPFEFPNPPCKGIPWLFYPRLFEREHHRLAREALAKAICNECPHKEPCGQDALNRRDPFGLWGGLSEDDRERIRPSLPLADDEILAECQYCQTPIVRSHRATNNLATCVPCRRIIRAGRGKSKPTLEKQRISHDQNN